MYSFIRSFAFCKYSCVLNLIHRHVLFRRQSPLTHKQMKLGISKAKFITLDLLTAQRLQVKAVIDSHPLWLVESEICVTYMTIKLYL